MVRIAAITLTSCACVILLTGADGTSSPPCTSDVDTSWEKHVRTVYFQQWQGTDSARYALREFFNATNQQWNTTFNHLSGPDNYNIRAVCPWNYTTNFDARRIPQYIPWAQCYCKYCLGSVDGASRSDLKCTPVMYRLLVLRQEAGFECHHGRLKYSPASINVPVACTCLRNNGRKRG